MKTYILLSFIAISVVFSAYQHTVQACEEGWFGHECQYKCRCQQACSPEGECPGQCEDGWFGYKCQYSLIQYNAIANQSEEDITDLLTDNDETTCIDIGEQSIILDLNNIFYNPWIRLFTQQPDLMYDLKMSYENEDSEIAVATSKERFIIKDKFVDIHISVNDYVAYIILEGHAIQRLCSLWVSNGQNVATKQNVYYSNSSISQIDTNLPQYPQATDGVYTCNESDTGRAGYYWLIVMNPSFFLRNYNFYVNDVIGVYRYFSLQELDDDGEMFSTFNSSKLPSSTFIDFVSNSNISSKAIIFFVTNWSTNKTLPLLLCEVELYAECQEGTWGDHCTNTCNKNCPDLCRFDDGLCSDACLGYSDPPKCTNVCKTGYWGLNCTKTCSNHCYNSTCDSKSGVCDRGCLGYSDYPQCSSECEAGFWGLNCVNKCDKCADSSCNSKTGWCDKGCVGYSDAPFCYISCPSGSWGVNCTNKCSDSCVGISCDAKTGFCDRGYIVTTNRTMGVSGSGNCRAHLELLISSTIIVCALSLGTHYVCVIVFIASVLFRWIFGWSSLSIFSSPLLDVYSKTDNKDIKMNAHSEGNPYTDVFDIHEFQASHQINSEAEDFAEHL